MEQSLSSILVGFGDKRHARSMIKKHVMLLKNAPRLVWPVLVLPPRKPVTKPLFNPGYVAPTILDSSPWHLTLTESTLPRCLQHGPRQLR